VASFQLGARLLELSSRAQKINLQRLSSLLVGCALSLGEVSPLPLLLLLMLRCGLRKAVGGLLL
jgi:hypothetical protein